MFCRVSPRRARYFLLLRQKKVPKEKASRVRRPSAALRARCVARPGREVQKLALRAQTSALLFPPWPALLASSHGNRELDTKRQQGRAMARPCGVRWLGSGCRLFCLQCRVAGLSSAAAGGSGRALFERSEFSPTPPGASSARYPAGALTSAALLFGDFLFGTQEKVTALSGAHPDKATSARAVPEANSLPGAHPGNVPHVSAPQGAK